MDDLTLTMAASVLMAAGAWAWRRRRTRARDQADADDAAPTPWSPGQPGRAAIDAALGHLYGDTLERHWPVEPEPGAAHALEEVVAFLSLTPTAHWHYIGLGLSELGDKCSGDARKSGLGFELTVRLTVEVGDEPPAWPVELLRALAARITDAPYRAGEAVVLAADERPAACPGTEAVGFVEDRSLRTVKTANGDVHFLQVLPFTGDEHALLDRWDASWVFAEMRAIDAGLVWHPGRASILAGDRGAALERRAEGTWQVACEGALSWDAHTLGLDIVSRDQLAELLRTRIADDRPAMLQGEGRILRVEVGETALHLDDTDAVLRVPVDEAVALAERLRQATPGDSVAWDGVALARVE